MSKKVRNEATQKISQIDKSGMPFFCTLLEEPLGDLKETTEAFEIMNQPITKKTGEIVKDVRGIGKLALSTNDDQMIVACYVPKDKELSAKDWLESILASYPDAEVNEVTDDDLIAIGTIKNNPDKDIYVFKMRDEIISKQYAFLREKGLLPPVEVDEDEELLGDDIFA